MRGRWVLGVAAILGFAGLGIGAGLLGCVKTEERITVAPDGGAKVDLKIEGDLPDWEKGAPMLAEGEGWVYHKSIEEENDGKKKVTVLAGRTVDVGVAFPDQYPLSDSSKAPLALRHPTSVRVERRDDGTYYHFRRVYEARPYAFVSHWYHEYLENFQEDEPKKMDEDKLEEFVNKLGKYALHKRFELILAANREIEEALSHDDVLAARDAVVEALDGIENEEVVKLLKEGDDEGLDKLADRLDSVCASEIRKALLSGKVAGNVVEAFERAMARVKELFAITEDYEDEEWVITLTMPGEVVAHNAMEVEDGALAWKFDGSGVFDRDFVLMATSRVVGSENVGSE